MECEEARPFISELCDRELISREIAEHIFGCADCRARLRDYATMGADLRLLASESLSQAAAPFPQRLPPRRSRWARRWTIPLLVPRYVAVSVLAAILVLSVGMGLVQAQRGTEAARQEFQQALMRGEIARMAALLQKNGALANAPNDMDMFPLHVVATRWIPDEPAAQMARILIAAGADVNARTYSQQTPLHMALMNGKQEIVALLLAHGADLNARDWQGMTPLDRALQMRDPRFVEMLRAKGATPDVFNATELGETALVSELLAREPALVNARDPLGRTLLEIAAAKPRQGQGPRRPDLVQLLLSYQPRMDIFVASVAGQMSLVKKFLDSDPGLVKAENERGMTPLYFAVLGGHKDVAELLLQRGADVGHGHRYRIEGTMGNDESREGWTTPLHEAAWNGDRELALLLLKHGADPRAHTQSGATPYHLALMNGHRDLAEELAGLSRHAGPAADEDKAGQQNRPSRQGPDTDAADNENAAIGVFRTINTVEVVYAMAYAAGFSDGLNALGAPPAGRKPDKNNAGLVDEVLAGRARGGTNTSFERKGYRFVYKPGVPDAKGNIAMYTLIARPIEYGKTGKRSFYCDQTAIIRGTDEDREPNAKDPPL